MSTGDKRIVVAVRSSDEGMFVGWQIWISRWHRNISTGFEVRAGFIPHRPCATGVHRSNALLMLVDTWSSQEHISDICFVAPYFLGTAHI